MASYIYEECGDKYVKKYIIDAGNLTSVHVLGVEDKRKLEDSIEEMLELNSSQHTSDHSRNISSCPRQQEYPPDVRTR